MHEALKNILQYLTPEILAWESGNIREVRPLGSVLCLPDGREWYAFGFTRNAYDGSLSLLMASSQRECGEWARANSPVAIRFGAQRYLIDGTGYEMFDGSDMDVKKMIAGYIIKRVDVYSDYRLHIEFNMSFAQFELGLETEVEYAAQDIVS